MPKGDQYTFNVVIDAGHGGSDPGAQWEEETEDHTITMEKNINLAVANLIPTYLPKFVNCHRSRKTDVFRSFRQRAVTPYQYDLLVSIHCNAVRPPKTEEQTDPKTGKVTVVEIEENRQQIVRGSEVWIRTDEDELSVSLAEKFLPVVAKALNIPVNENPIRKSKNLRVLALADQQVDRFGRSTSVLRPAAMDNSYGEKGKGSPGILIELGYLTHEKDRKALNSVAKQRAVARAIAGAIALLAPKPERA